MVNGEDSSKNVDFSGEVLANGSLQHPDPEQALASGNTPDQRTLERNASCCCNRFDIDNISNSEKVALGCVCGALPATVGSFVLSLTGNPLPLSVIYSINLFQWGANIASCAASEVNNNKQQLPQTQEMPLEDNLGKGEVNRKMR